MLSDDEYAAILAGNRGSAGVQFASFEQSGLTPQLINEIIGTDRTFVLEVIDDWEHELLSKLGSDSAAADLVSDAIYELKQHIQGKKL